MLRCTSRGAFAILIGAAFIVSMMPVWAEHNLSDLSRGFPDSSYVANNSIFNCSEFDNISVINNNSVQAAMLKLPLSFIENRGQSSDDVKFMVKTSRQTVFFTPSEVAFALSGSNNSSMVHMAFEGSKPGQIIGEEQLPGTANFFIGNDSSKWITEIPTFSAVRYKDLYPGVDLVFKGIEGHLKHELILSPGADPTQIVLAYSGQDNMSLAEDGSVLIRTATGNLTDSAPICYQEIDGSRVTVEGQYRLIKGQKIGFEIGNYDKRYPLVIDPVLIYSTYLGGSDYDYGNGIALDGSGNAYVTGYTDSTNFPIQNPIQASKSDGTFYADVFITKINAARSALVYSTYLGGGSGDGGYGISVDSSGNAYVTGATYSTNFPIKNPIQASNGGNNDAFITKIDAAGSALIYSTYLGGSSYDYAYGIAIDGDGNSYVTGLTGSSNYPTKNSIQASHAGGNGDVFITKINEAGSALVYSTYLGGSNNDHGYRIAVDGSNNVYITGWTLSTNFPTKNPIQASNGGNNDAFVTKIDAAGSALVYSTYLGGSGNENSQSSGATTEGACGVGVDGNGNVYITGWTLSTNFPTKNPIQASNGGSIDAFITKIDASGSALIYSTYLGGSNYDYGNGIALDSSGNAYVTGLTGSTNFPTQNAFQAALAGGSDAFVTKLSPAGNILDYSTYLGGSGNDGGGDIAVDSSCNAYVTGVTYSIDFPTQNPMQTSNAGGIDAFMAVVGQAAASGPSIEWQKCLGGSNTEWAYNIQQTSDGGYILVGGTDSNNCDVSGNHGGTDSWVVKLASPGVIQWRKCLGGSDWDNAWSIQQTEDGGYILAGDTTSNNFNVSGNHGGPDFWVVKLDDSGDIQWQKCLGGSGDDEARSIQQTIDGGYVVAGFTSSNDGNVSGNHGGHDFWIVKLDDSGDIRWQKCLGGSDNDYAYGVKQTADGGYIVAGEVNSNNGNVSGNHGLFDFWVVRLDSSGTIQWQRCLGGSSGDGALSIQQTIDGGYIVAGDASSNNGDVSNNHGSYDFWVVKLDLSGVIEWQKCLGGNNWDGALSIQQTIDGGYIVAGDASSNNGDVSNNHGGQDSWVVKLDESGDIQWRKCLGGSDGEVILSIQQTKEGGFIAAGWTISNDGDVSGNHGSYDAWVVKLSSEIEPATVGGRVWNDANYNGIQDPQEEGVSGVIVNLYAADGTDSIANIATDSDGGYSFNSLSPGDYLVEFALPSGYAFSPNDQGNDDTKDSDVIPTTGTTQIIHIDAGQIDKTWDSGIHIVSIDPFDSVIFDHIYLFPVYGTDLVLTKDAHLDIDVRSAFYEVPESDWNFELQFIDVYQKGEDDLVTMVSKKDNPVQTKKCKIHINHMYPGESQIISYTFKLDNSLTDSSYLGFADRLKVWGSPDSVPIDHNNDNHYGVVDDLVINQNLIGETAPAIWDGFKLFMDKVLIPEIAKKIMAEGGEKVLEFAINENKLVLEFAANGISGERGPELLAKFVVDTALLLGDTAFNTCAGFLKEILVNINDGLRLFNLMWFEIIKLIKATGHSIMSLVIHGGTDVIITTPLGESINIINETITNSIPNSSAFLTPDSKFVMIAGQEDLNIHIKGTNATTMEVACMVSVGDNESLYNQYKIPVIQGTILTTAYTNTTGVEPIKVDIQGDGINDEVIYPEVTKFKDHIIGINTSVTVTPSINAPESNVVFTINVTNIGNVTLKSVKVNDNIPIGLSYISDNRTGLISGRNITWDILTPLGNESSTFIQLIARIDPFASGNLTNLVEATGIGATNMHEMVSNKARSVVIVNTPPKAPSKPSGSASGYAYAPYSYSISTTDPDEDQVRFTFNWGDGTTFTTGLINSGTAAIATHKWTKAGTFKVKANATDRRGAPSGWSSSLTVTIAANKPPGKPSKPSGSASGYAWASYSYSTSAIDPDKNKVKYASDWGDGTSSSTGSVSSGTSASASHKWTTAGTFNIKANATDSRGAPSAWSSSLTVTIAANNPPSTPSDPSGPAFGKPGTSYSYSASGTDPDGNRVNYTFNWGDGTSSATSTVDSDTEASKSHKWSKAGTYQVKARTKDSRGALSGWSGPLNVTINTPPATPSKPAGASSGKKETSYSYSTSATDPDKDKVKYTFDWGDGTNSTTSLVNSGVKASKSHKWSTAGTFKVKAKATDSRGGSSGWSSSLTLKIT